MRRYLLLIFSVLVYSNSVSQSWERLITSGGSSGNEVFSDMHLDSQGNVYLTGSFSGSATFGNTLLTSNGATDFFVVKYDSSGNLIYAVNGGSSSADLGNAIVSDNNGNAYITGLYSGFFTIAGITLLVNGSSDIFTVKVDTLGNFVWGKKAGGIFDFYGSTYQDRGLDIAFDNSNGIYVSGVSSGQSMVFGPFINGPSQSAATDFVGKYDLNGNEQWIRSASDPNATFSSGFSLSTSLVYNPITNSIIVAGYNSITVSIGGGGISKNSDLYFRQILTNGTLGWYRQFGGTAQEEVVDIALDGAGNIYATGLFNGNIAVPLGTVVATAINDGQNSEVSDAFILKLNPDASALNYVKLVSGSQDIDGLAITSSPTGTVYASGKYKGTPGVDNVALNPRGEFDIFLLRIDSLGNLNWAEEAGGSGDDVGVNIEVTSDEKILFSGGFSSVAEFGNTTLTSLGFSDAFFATLDCKPGLPRLKIAVDTSVCIGDSSEIILDEKFGTDYIYNLLSGGIVDTSGASVSVLWTNPGIHQLQITPINDCGQGTMRTIQFEIQDVPGSSQILGDTNICLGLGTYSVLNTEANSFTWSLNGGGSLVPLGNQTLVSWSSPGQFILSVMSSNTCGSGSVDSIVISVAQFPSGPLIISGNNSSCVGTDTFTINTQAETTYSWDLSSGGIINQFDSFAIVTWTQAGSHIVQVTPSNICGTGNTSSKIINVLTKPTNEAIIGDSIVCIGSSSFSLPSINGAIYNWNVSGGGLLLNLGNTSIVNWNSPGNYFVTASIQNSCGQSLIDTFDIEVRSSAIQPGLISGLNSVCIGSESYSVPQQVNQTYEWSLSSGGNLNFVNNQASINWTQTGFHTLTVTALNDCGQGLSRDLVVEVKTVPNQPGVIFGDDEVCLGLENYNVFSESGITYNWAISGGGQIFPSNNSVSVNWTLAGDYELIVSPSNQCGNGSPRILPIEVKDVPEGIVGIEGIDSVCLGNQIYSVSNPQVGNDLIYNWSLSGGGLIAPNGNTASINWTTPGTYALTVQAQNSCGFGQPFSKFITVRNVNEQFTSIIGDDLVCIDTSAYQVALIGGFNYNWSLSGGGILNAANNLAEVIWTNTGNYTLTVATSDGCTKSLPVEVKDIPSQPSVIAGDTVVCFGSRSYAVEPITGQTYNWAISGGGTISPFGNAAIANWNAVGNFDVSVSSSNLCGTGPQRVLDVDAITVPISPVFTNPDTLVCKNQSITYSISPNPFESYAWNLNRAGLINPNNDNASIQWLDTGVAILTVNATNQCGTGIQNNLSIRINDAPALPTILGPSKVCLDSVVYLTAQKPSVTYNWNLLSGGALNTDLNSSGIVWTNPGVHDLQLSLSNNCGTGPTQTLIVEAFDLPVTPILTQGDTVVCLGLNAYEVQSNPEESYTWTISGGGNLSSQNNTATINWTGIGFHEIFVQASNLCGLSSIDTILVEVRRIPFQPSIIAGDANVCLDNRIYSVNPVNNVTYNWSLNGNGNLIAGDSANVSVDWLNPGLSIISVSASNLCGTGPTQSKSISIFDIPQAPVFTSGDTLACIGQETYSVAASSGLTYNWNVNGGGSLSSNGNQATINWNQTGNWFISSSLGNFCGTGVEDTLFVRIKTLPNALTFLNPDTIVCLGNTVYEVASQPELTYSWTLNGGGSFSSVNNQAFVTWTTPGVYSLSVTPVNICGSGISSSSQIDVSTIPSAPVFNNLDTLSCLGNDTYSVFNQSASSFLWNLSSGGGSSSSGNQLNVNWTSTGTFPIEVSAFNFCGSSAITTANISVNQNPEKPILISGDTVLCLSFETYQIQSVADETYNWNLSSGGLLNSSGDSAIVNWLVPGNHIISIIAENYCGQSQSLQQPISAKDIPSRPTNLTGSTNVCNNDEQVYAVQNVTEQTYKWTISNLGTLSSDSNSVRVFWSEKGEQVLEVSTLNDCGESDKNSILVNVRDVPDLQGNILGASKICEGSLEEYSVSSLTGSLYLWNLKSGGEINAQENLATIDWLENGTHILAISASNICGTGDTVLKEITVDSIPVQPEIVVQSDSLFSNLERDNVWYLNEEVLSTGGLPFIIPTETGQYTLQIINSCGVSEISDFISFYGGENLEEEIYIFPNPANNFITIKIPLNLGLDYIRVINSEGRRIAGIDLEGNSIQDLNIDYLRPGMYFIELNIEGQGSFFKKLIIN